MNNPWFEFEGDRWFLRNKQKLGDNFDFCLFLLDLYSIIPKNVLEIGCSNGYRLAKIYERFMSNVVGIEPSKKAIEDGMKKYPFVRFIRAMCETIDIDDKFDLIIVNFVFHWIQRENLYSCVQRIDYLLEDKGYLIIGDFGTDFFIKKVYHHIKDSNFYTWKMAYWKLFTSSGKYIELAKLRFNHDTHRFSSDIDISNMGTVVLLKKTNISIEL